MIQIRCKSVLLAVALTMLASVTTMAAGAGSTETYYSSSFSTTSYTEKSQGTAVDQTVTFHQQVNDNGTRSTASFSMNGTSGGEIAFTAAHQQLVSDFTGENVQSIRLSIIDNSLWQGSINQENKAIYAKVSLDKTSTWEATGDSYVTVLADEDQTMKNIKSAHTIYYDKSAKDNQWLQGKTIALTGGGKLMPRP